MIVEKSLRRALGATCYGYEGGCYQLPTEDFYLLNWGFES